MVETLLRYRQDALLVVIAAIVTLFSYQALQALPYYPQQWPWLVLGIIAVLTLMNPRAGIAVALLFQAPAIGRISLELGVGYLVASLILIASSGDKLISAFFLLSVVAAGSWFEPFTYLLFVVPPLAGMLYGTTGGMMLAASAALFVEILGIIAGRAMLGPVYAGGTAPLYQALPPVAVVVELSWLRTGLTDFSPLSVIATLLRPFAFDPQYTAQIALWLVSGYFAARLTRQEKRWSQQNALALAVGTGILVIGHILIPWGLRGYGSPVEQVIATGLVSGLVGFLVYPVLEFLNQLSAGFDLR